MIGHVQVIVRSRSLHAVCLQALISVGCALVTDFDVEPGEAVSSSSTAASTGSGNPSDCAPDETCIAVPADWQGPVALAEGAAPLPDCDAGWTATDAFAGNVIGTVTCNACTCSDPVGGTCDTQSLTHTSDCVNASSTTALTPYACMQLPLPAPWILVPPIPVIPGQCTASGGETTLGEVSWEAAGRLCTAEGTPTSCGNGAVCEREPSADLAWPCVFREGMHRCPAGYERTSTTIYGGADDTRACSACGCGLEGASCSGAVTAYNNSSCSQNPTSMTQANCYGFMGGPFWVKYVPGASSPGSCVAAGGTAMGAVTPALPTTVCCAGPL